MKKTIICNITMRENSKAMTYASDDKSVPVSDRAVLYPICTFLEKNLESSDDVKVILLVKKDRFGRYKQNAEDFKDELLSINESIGASIHFETLYTEFQETRSVHEELLGELVNQIEDNTKIYADVTFGPKDLIVVLFTALNFAEKFLKCSVENIIYGQAQFENHQPTDTKICDMVPLYSLAYVTNLVRCDDPQKARNMLKNLISM